jgi:hypothetical protein
MQAQELKVFCFFFSKKKILSSFFDCLRWHQPVAANSLSISARRIAITSGNDSVSNRLPVRPHLRYPCITCSFGDTAG